MWPQLGCRQGYSDGEVGEGVLNGTSARVELARFGKRRGMTITFSIKWTNEDNSILPESTLLSKF